LEGDKFHALIRMISDVLNSFKRPSK
jgi:hypothetical protein